MNQIVNYMPEVFEEMLPAFFRMAQKDKETMKALTVDVKVNVSYYIYRKLIQRE